MLTHIQTLLISSFFLYVNQPCSSARADGRTNVRTSNRISPPKALNSSSHWTRRNSSTENQRIRLPRKRGVNSPRTSTGTPTRRQNLDTRPTPEPTGPSSSSTTVYITDENNFALLLPANDGELISEAESDGIAYCTSGSGCSNAFPDGFITGAAVTQAGDGSYIQITGCLDSSRFHFALGDDGGQFDTRFPNGAQCTFGGYGASFIEQVEPSANRFCLRCCKSDNDQQNCNSHQDRAGCLVAVPGTYDFPSVSCS
ncbi:hypothetical protein F5I97DRAFT_1874181 [Phlebopus sp. FC_14]|nr:hypothetical protein F5I97DRAFT_1874181 [Phlebopus sp. FC_14]